MTWIINSFRRLKSYFTHTFLFEDKQDLEWKQQAAAVERNSMYKLLQLGGTGYLVDEFLKRETDNQYLELVRKEIEPFLYRNESDGIITELEFAKYRRKLLCVNESYDVHYLSDEELLEEFHKYQLTAINKFTPHAACWDINNRGTAGETIIHLCYLVNTNIHKSIARHLLKLYPRLALDVYEGSAYYGETALHLAIVNNDLETVKFLVNDCHARLDARATGRFFRPNGIKKGLTTANEKLDYQAQAYYGEYPLAFAASLGFAEIYDFLVEASVRSKEQQGKCNPDAADSYGNTIIHMIVIHNQKLMFNHAVFHSKMPVNFTSKNNAGLTALQLSFKLGRGELFTALLDLTSETQWIFGNVAYVAYPLDQLDSIGPNGSMNKQAAITTIVENDSIPHLKMLDDQVLNELLDKKWKSYAKNRLLFKFFWAILHLLEISIAVYLRPAGDLRSTDGPVNKFRIFIEVSLVIGCFAKVITEILEILSRGSLLNYLTSLIHFPTKGLFNISVCLQLSCVLWRFLGLQVVEDYAFITSIPLAWHYLFFFFRCHPVLGPLIVSLQKIVVGDLFRFSVIYSIFLIMFAGVFYFMFINVPAWQTDAFLSANGSFMTLFRMSFGDLHFNDMIFSRFGTFTFLIFGIFLIAIPLLLFNMMIAMMTRTFQNTQDRSLMEWKRQWVMIILNIERSLPRRFLVKLRESYSSDIKVHRDQKARRVHQKPLLAKMFAAKSEREKDEDSMASASESSEIPLVNVSAQGDTTVDAGRVTNNEYVEVKAVLVHKVMTKSQAAMRRDVQLKWRTLRRKLLDAAKERLARRRETSHSQQN
ncbi:transient receptor potential cation channel subfamily V member 6-like isoform X2 [Apostichopus japonicus]|uniref:transient receptor potential cation channel subfamily V member 6-like isoform X2 n=1 Tax=Stichopus japonicus TaxID=307972 RepID=UPI003AB74C83